MLENDETAAMLVYQSSPVGVELFSQQICMGAGHVSGNALLPCNRFVERGYKIPQLLPDATSRKLSNWRSSEFV